MERKTIDIKVIRQELSRQGKIVQKKSCCGKVRYRTDYRKQLQELGYTGTYIVKDNGVYLGLYTL